jgi:3-oxoacyl-[acyl-carrier-protein] synthase II
MNERHCTITVTGLAAISSGGVGIDSLREALQDGISRLQPIPEEIWGENGHFWGKAQGFKASDHMPPLKARKFDRCSLFAVVAAGMALKDAGIDLAQIDPARVGILLGCGFGGIANSEEFLRGYLAKGADGLIPMLFPNTVPNAPASNASIEHGLKGPNVTTVQRFCSAESAFLMACRFLEEDRADVILTGGVDELNPVMLQGFKSAGQLRRYGQGFGEGAGLLVLEKMGEARRRGAAIRAEVGNIRTVGRLISGAEDEGVSRLLATTDDCSLISLSGVAGELKTLLEKVPAVPRLETGKLLGRSLAMGGLSMAALVVTLLPGQHAVHLAASPEGPYYAVDFRGGASV